MGKEGKEVEFSAEDLVLSGKDRRFAGLKLIFTGEIICSLLGGLH
jgi:hypothetical protein